MAIKLILDTDIGTDVDDAWALALCLASSDIELIGVTLVYGDLDIRARIALKMLKLAGREDIPVFRGLSQPLTPGAGVYWAGHEGTDTDFSDISELQPQDDAVGFIMESAAKYAGELAVCTIGPITNLAEAIRRSPDIMRRVGRFAMMATTYEGDGIAAKEHNAASDPAATRTVLESRIPATVVGLNVTRQVCVRRDALSPLKNTPFGRYLAAMTRQYLGVVGRDFTYMHDPLAVAALTNPALIQTRKMSASVSDDGHVLYTRSDDGWLDVCTSVDSTGFEGMLLWEIGEWLTNSD